MTPENKRILKEQEKFYRKLKRYKEYKVKQPKTRSKIQTFGNGSVFVDRDWQYKKLGLDAVEAAAEVDED